MIARTMPKPRPFRFSGDIDVKINYFLRVSSVRKIVFKNLSIGIFIQF